MPFNFEYACEFGTPPLLENVVAKKLCCLLKGGVTKQEIRKWELSSSNDSTTAISF